MAKIYTKVGDKGQTSLVGGQKIAKDDIRLDAYGTVDELNSALGFARASIRAEVEDAAKSGARPVDGLASLEADLELVQHWLFDLGSLLASLPADREKFKLPPLGLDHVTWLEGRIDGASAVLKPLRNFILPAGSETATRLHMARTIARRAERLTIAMTADIPENAIPFLNRVSDYLFVMARFANHLLGVTDVEWKKTQPAV